MRYEGNEATKHNCLWLHKHQYIRIEMLPQIFTLGNIGHRTRPACLACWRFFISCFLQHLASPAETVSS